MLKDSIGKIKDAQFCLNTVTVYGDYMAANNNAGQTVDLIDYMSIGTVAGGKDTTSNALENQVYRKQLTSTTQPSYGDANDNDVIYVCTFDANEPATPETIIEAGLHNHLSNDNDNAGWFMFAYQEGFTVTKAVTDSLTGMWTVSYGVS